MIRQTVLDNGVTVATNSLPAKSVAVSWTLHAGAAHEPQGYHGAAHAFEHVACSIRHIMAPIERMGCDFSAGTNHEMIRMEAEVWPDKMQDTLTRLLVHGLAAPEINEDSWEREQPRILMEIMEDDQDRITRMMNESDAFMYGAAPRGRNILGTAQDVHELDPEKIRWFHQHILNGPNIVVCVAGDIKHEAVVREVERRLAHVPSRVLAAPPPSLFRADGMGLTRDDLPGNEVMVQYRGAARGSPANPVYKTLELMLSGDQQSFMFNRLSFQEGLVYGLTADSESWRDDGLLRFNLTTSLDKSQKALNSFARQMEHMPERLASKDFERVRRKRDFLLQRLETKPLDWVEQAAQDMPLFGHVRTLEEVRDVLNGVTLQQVRDAAAEMVGQGAFVTAMGKVENLRILEPFAAAQARRIARLPKPA